MVNKLKNLPPHVVRELKRHVSPGPLPKFGAAGAQAKPKKKPMSQGMKMTLGGSILLTVTAGSIPLLATWWIGNLAQREEALTAPQVRRGAFLNSGTRDIGRDPDWDFKSGTHAYNTSAKNSRDDENLPAEFLALGRNKMGAEEEQALADAAKGIKRKKAEA